jgi:hypothetical protein
MRWGIGRMRYRIAPGLYAVGSPGEQSPVMVTANYKLTFDALRTQLTGLDAWILVIDTQGVNVWCSAGKGTFNAAEVAKRVEETGLRHIVSRRLLIVPQLAAPGLSAREVEQRCGFAVVFGPVRAEDLHAFLAAGMIATPAMRQVEFPLTDRLAVTPIEIVQSARKAALVAAALFLLSALGAGGSTAVEQLMREGVPSALLFFGVWLASQVLFAVLLPWLPGRAFALKGASLGLALSALFLGGAWFGPNWPGSPLTLAAWCLALPALSSFVALKYTGSTPFTSPSGVRYEIRRAVPLQAAVGVVAAGLWLADRFFSQSG